jgi:hypothetical protein
MICIEVATSFARRRVASSCAKGEPLVLEAAFVPLYGPAAFGAAVGRALVTGGWPSRMLTPEPTARATGHQLGQQCCPKRNMANSPPKHKSDEPIGPRKAALFARGAAITWLCRAFLALSEATMMMPANDLRIREIAIAPLSG